MPAPTVESVKSRNATTAAPVGRVHPELRPDLGQKKSKLGVFGRPILLSLAIFTAVNVGLAQFTESQQNKNPKAPMGDFWTNPAVIDLAIKQYNEQPTPAKVVLLGSSLVMFPFWAMDAAFNPAIDDIAHYHKSKALEAALAKTGAGELKDAGVYSLASAGQMSSDTYLYASEFLKGKNKPEVIVWGIAPRDFSDDNVKSPMSTVSFKQIVGLNNFNDYAETFLPRFEDKAEFVANHSCFLYGRRWRLQKEAERGLERVSATVAKVAGAPNLTGSVTGAISGSVAGTTGSAAGDLPKIANSSAVSNSTVASNLPAVSNLAAPLKPSNFSGAQMAALLAGTAEQRWETSTKEYRGRYKGIAERDMNVQMDCLEKTLKICKERGIKVVLVNMPLTTLNQSLMAEGFYERFGKQVQAVAAKYGKDVTFVDRSHDSKFQDADFWDTVHMNHVGGSKLIGDIVPAIRAYLLKQ